jgi:hypothetical protein
MSESASRSASPLIVENVTRRLRQGNTIIDAQRLATRYQEVVGTMPAVTEGNQ